jgi:hypothetical protein
MRKAIIWGSAPLFALGLLGGLAFWQGLSSSPASIWREIAWPFGRDAWPPGRAFRCIAAECGDGAELYVRPKMGFCNCALGVSDDDEVDRVTDLDLLSERFRPSAPGQPVLIAGLAGRARSYVLEMPDGTARTATAIALSHGCDALVALTNGQSPEAPPSGRAALDLLSSKALMAWMGTALGRASGR